MTKMIERVARALCKADGLDWEAQANPQTSGNGDDNRDAYMHAARAAIEVMREVFGEMVQAGADEIAPYQTDTPETYRAKCEIALDVFGAMIDAALADD